MKAIVDAEKVARVDETSEAKSKVDVEPADAGDSKSG